MSTSDKIPFKKFTILQEMDLVCKVELKLAGNECLSALCLKKAIWDKEDNALILQTIKDMARDNITLVQDLLGVKLTDEIIKFE